MTPAAILDILVRANTAKAQTQLAGVQRTVRQSDKEVERFAVNSEKNIRRFHRTVHAVVGASGLAGLAFGLKDVTEEAVKADAEQRKLGVSVKNAGINWKAHSKAIDESLIKASQWSGFAKSELSAALGNAVRTTGSLSKANDLLNISMNVARTRGIGLAGAQTLVARAYLGNLRGLKTLGVGIEPVTKAHDRLHGVIVKVGDSIRNSSGMTKEQLTLAKERLQSLKNEAKSEDDHATRIKAIGLLQTKFAGQAKAYANSTAGQFERAKASMTIAEETIGKALLPSFASVATKVAEIAQKVTKNWPEIKKTISETVGPIWSFARGVGEFVAHHKLLREVAIAFASVAASVKIIEKLGAISGITRLVGLTAAAGGGGGRAGTGLVGEAALVAAARGGRRRGFVLPRATDAEVAAGRTQTGAFLLGRDASYVARTARQEEVVARRAAAAERALRPGLVARSVAAARRGVGLGAAEGVAAGAGAGTILSRIKGVAGRAVLPVAVGVIADKAIRGVANTSEKNFGIPTTGGGFKSFLRDMEHWSLDQPKAETATRKFGDAVQKLHGNLTQLDSQKLEGMASQARQLAKDFPSAAKGLTGFANTAEAELGRRTAKVIDGMHQDFALMRVWAKGDMDNVSRIVSAHTREIANRFGLDSKAGKDALAENFSLAAAAVQHSMDASVISTDRGMKKISQLLADALAQLGIKATHGTGKGGRITMGDYQTLSRRTGSGQPSGLSKQNQRKSGLATGGWVGAPGMAGPDQIPIMVGAGEAVVNRHQQKPIEAALNATYGIGLSDLFDKMQRPHYMATGGYAGDIPPVHVRSDLGLVSRISQGAVDRDRDAARAWLRRAIGAAAPSGRPGKHGALPASSFSGSQLEIARMIVGVGRSMGAPANVLLAAIETGIVESGLRNLRYGDRDSLGVFQQRPSQGWGTPAQVLDVPHAAASFFSRAIPLAKSGRTPGAIAQAVQRSRYPGRYDAQRASALRILHELGQAGSILHGHARGGFVGKIAGFQLGGAITDITQNLPAPNAPVGSKHPKPKKPKAPEKPVRRYNPVTKKIEWHTPSQWQRITTDARAHPKPVQRFRPATGQIESHTPAEWQRINTQDAYRRAHPITTPAQRAYQYYQDISSQVDVEIAAAALTPDVADDILAQQHHLTLDQSRMTAIDRALRKHGVSAKTKQRLTAEKATLLGDIKSTQDTIAHINAPDSGTGEDPNQALIDAINANTEQQQKLEEAERERAQREQDLRDALKSYVDFASSVANVTSVQAIRALSDAISGEITGRGYAGRAFTASSGSVVRA